MASYTMELRNYIEMFTQYEEGLSIREKIEVGRTNLFDFYYPLYDDDYRKIFETNIIRKFYMREIGFETEELFKFQLETWLNINMPYFNKLFESELFDYDPLMNAQMVVAHDKTNGKNQVDERLTNQVSETDGRNTGSNKQDSSSTGESVQDDFNRNVSSEMPESRLQLQTEQGKGVIEYASEIDENKADNKTNSKGQSNVKSDTTDTTHVESTADQKDDLKSKTDETEHFIERRFGKVGTDSYSKMIQEYRNVLLRVEVQIHREMQELFMMVY